ncbi:MAG: 3-phosphoshikimate 1-carboxyvinyltransferase, partial [Gammaproteobacteria bacterium]|nr:3-phosphoshikimate 1-carboxyvinyltransferase [Gammaproteobacteria bacterium]
HGQPYIDMTLQWLSSQHIQYQRETKKNKTIYSVPGNQRYHHFHTTLTGDFSSASCPLTAATLLDGHVEFTGLDMADTQGDKQLLFILQKMGAHLTIESTRLSIQGGYPLQGIEIDAKNIPDLLPILAVIGTQATGKTYIYNIKQARFKETDRLHSMTEGLRKMGANLEEKEDSLTIYPNSLHGAIVNGYGDHRTVMALSVAGLLAEGNTCILGSEAIHKTYPSYIHTLCQLGADLYETNSS